MSPQLTGSPKVVTNVVDRAPINRRPLGGIVCLQGVTMRGEAGKPVFVSSSAQARRLLGGFHATDNFVKTLTLLLDAGLRGAYVSRAHSYTDINDLDSFQGTKATGQVSQSQPTDSTAPSFLRAEIITSTPGTLTLYYDENLDAGSVPSVGDYDVQVNSIANAVTNIQLDGRKVILTLTSNVTTGQTVTVSYTASANPIRDISENNSANLSTQAVLNLVGSSAVPTVSDRVAGPLGSSVIVISTNVALNESSTLPALADFDVQVNSVANALTAITIFENEIRLTLTTPLALGQTVTVAYTNSGNNITDLNGNILANFGAASVTLALGPSAIFTAKGVGDGYDGIIITVSNASNNNVSFCNISVSIPEIDNPQVLTNISRTPDANALTRINQRLSNVEITNIDTNIPNGTATLQGGVQDISLISSTDINGTLTGKTGWYSFSDVVDAFRIANIDRPDPVVDIGLAQFAQSRFNAGQPMAFHIGTPQGLNDQGFLDYRNGSGTFSHTPVDNYLGRIVAGQMNAIDPQDNDADFLLSGVAASLPPQSIKDGESGAWFSAARETVNRPAIANRGVEFNIGSPDLVSQYDTVSNAGINAIIKNERDQVVYEGNESLLRDNSSLLRQENISDLLIFIVRNLRPIAKRFLFQPNVPATWLRFYNAARIFITQNLTQNSAIEPIENQDWFWQGDQFVGSTADVQINNENDLRQGIYRARFLFIPISAIKFIGIDATLVNRNSISFALADFEN